MESHALLALIIFCLCLFCKLCASQDSTEIVLPQGKLEGVYNLYGDYKQYLGIPYASIKERFQEPGDPPSWNGTLDARRRFIKCKQMFSPLKIAVGEEDCLVLNVYTPTLKMPKQLPVMVFIHGGGFYWGSDTDLIYNPKYLIEKKVIVVTVNYRLGAFGFLCLRQKEAPGNVGLKDQLAALKWVKNNIRHFGGNSNAITLFGQSVGAAAVNYLMLSQSGKGLFHRVILESGSVLMPFAFDDDPIKSAAIVASKLGYNTTDPKKLLEIFKSTAADDIVRASYVDPFNNALAPYIFKPCLENPDVSKETIIRAHPNRLLETMKLDNDISMIIGFNNKEGLRYAAHYSFEGIENLNNDFSKALPSNIFFRSKEDKTDFIKEIKSFYFNNKQITSNGLIDYFSDALIVYPTIATVQYLLKNTNVSVYNYYFKYDSLRNLNKLISGLPLTPGANHGDELFYLFNPIIYQPLPMSPNDYTMVNKMTNLWTTFAKTGKPTLSSAKYAWKRSVDKQLNFLELDKNVKMGKMANVKRVKFWTKMYEKYSL
uniref:Carboxylesterase 9 n=1 Tax=Streltzoviella insularis TaxID=1206366 RepID=A0A7D5YIR4_9NEOP|nr:carboxylesterase 9 [Streltzoviella insularis]